MGGGAGSHKNLGYQAIGNIRILSACRMVVSMPATLHGFPGPNSPQVRASPLSYISLPGEQLIPFLLPPCQLWPLGATHASGNTSDLLQPVQMEGFGQEAENSPACTMKPRKRMRRGARWEPGGEVMEREDLERSREDR